MQITEEWLRDKEACESGIDWWLAHGKSTVSETFKVISDVPQNGLWLIENSLDRVQSIKLAIFCAELVGGDCDISRKAIDAAKAVLANDCEETRSAARDAAAAAAYDDEYVAAAVTAVTAAYDDEYVAAAVAIIAAVTAKSARSIATTITARHATYKQIFNYASELTKCK